jgi:hypothetical protein
VRFSFFVKGGTVTKTKCHKTKQIKTKTFPSKSSQPTCKLANRPTNQPTNQPTDQPTNLYLPRGPVPILRAVRPMVQELLVQDLTVLLGSQASRQAGKQTLSGKIVVKKTN